MYIQVIQGRVADAEGLRRQMERWDQELRPGATGFLGSTSGVSDDGEFIALARFESAEAARRNSDRPEQGAWWAETAKCLDGEPSFRNSTDVEMTLAGGSNDAGFVQVMQGRVIDRARAAAMEAEWLPRLREVRPDVIGSVRAWDGNFFTEAVYFTSEADARKGEATPAADLAQGIEQWMALVEGMRYIDLREPWLR